MLIKFCATTRKINKELKTIELTPRNRALLASYLRDRPVEYRLGVAPYDGSHHVHDLYRVTPNSTRGYASGIWFFDVSNVGDNARRFMGRSPAAFHVCEASMAGAEIFWRDDLNKVMEHRCPVAGRFTVFTAGAGYEIEHIALTLFEGRKTAAIVGGFDFVDGASIGNKRFFWRDVERVQRLYPSDALTDTPGLRRNGASRLHGAFNGVFHVVPDAPSFLFQPASDEADPEARATQRTVES